MPVVNFDGVEESGFKPVPEGEYLCKLDNVKEQTSKDGDEQWSLWWKVISDDLKTRNRLIFDNITFSERGMGRVKLLLSRLGFDVSGELDIRPGLLMGKQVYVSTYLDEYQGQLKNKVPYDGYREVPVVGSASKIISHTMRGRPQAPAAATTEEEEEAPPF